LEPSEYPRERAYSYLDLLNKITWEETLGGDSMSIYRGAKKWAEKAAWDFIAQEQPGFELVTFCSPYVGTP
jgi:hypothetical protein